jgi:uncharacterized protein YbjT (DUF2867 family)
MSNALVTVFGGSGFLGRNVVRALAKAGLRIRVAVRHPASAYFLVPMGTVGQIQVVKCNAGDADQVASALHGADAAINLIGIHYPAGGQGFDDAHVEAAANIAAAAREAGAATLVHVSAIGADKDSHSVYAATKGEGEARVRDAFPDAAILRPSVLFGSEDKFFNLFGWLARMSPALPLVGGGHTKFQPLFVGDAAAAVKKCVEDTATRGKTYEIGGPTVYSFKELMQTVLAETGRKRLLVSVPFFATKIKAFFLQFSTLLGFAPLLTPDQVEQLKTDNVVHADAPGIADLGIAPTALEAIVPSYLWRFRAKGQFEEPATSQLPELR